eukprot:TRINITY_DN4867_c0_g1_i3.p1 TRINITY_DN4867_c0_g1~~TRINITY_DN4867_c0_g1_i3.p1  ORF type:complete len:398 (+),score=109.56 TRINITY_DN4867_c0_g1_i3:435-1628(+)
MIESGISTSSPLLSMAENDDDFDSIETEKTEAYKALKDPNRVNVYQLMHFKLVLPKFRQIFMSQWNPREPEKAIKLMTLWSQILPPLINEMLLSQVIMSVLMNEVTKWNPRTDTQLISDWLLPWVDILSDRMEVLWEPIKNKLSKVLTQWNAMDESALYIVSQWKDVWPSNMYNAFLARSIYPKLEEALSSFIVNPLNQDLKIWNAVCSWAPIFHPDAFVSLLMKYFYPKWFTALHTWLLNSPDYGEVGNWYVNWKRSIPECIANDANIIDQFNQALEMLNISMEHPTLMPTTAPSPRYSPARPSAPSTPKSTSKSTPSTPSRLSSDISISMKNVLEKVAEDNNILLLPTKKLHEGKPIYQFGSVSVYVDKELVYSNVNSGKWAPISIDQLIKKSSK